MTRCFRVPLAVLLLAALGASGSFAASRYEPRLRFRVIATPHFSIYFHQGEEATARRLARIAEETRQTLATRLRLQPPARTHVILVDQTDLSNGWATPVPYDTIEITAIAPTQSSPLGNTDDWLRMVFTHEYTHILHLDQSGGAMRALRAVFGRTALAFPNLYLPLWQVEGLATYAESALTNQGRLNAGDFAALVSQSARAGRFEPIDRVGGGLVEWPSGNGAYLYGGYFTRYLADRYGEQTLGELAGRTARRVPLFGAGAFESVYGKKVADLWTEFARESKRAADSSTVAGGPQSKRLTMHGDVVSSPRILRGATPGSPATVWYAVQTPDEFPSIYHVGLDGTGATRVAESYHGEGLTASARWLYFDQLEISGAVSLLGDLYARNLALGRTWRLTHGKRVSSPDLSPDGTRLAVVVAGGEGRRIEILPLREPASGDGPPAIALDPLVSVGAPGSQYMGPRWSPDGSTLVAERRSLDGPSEIVLIDARTGSMSVVVSSRDARNITPSWAPDGRSIVFASARGHEPFQLHRVAVQEGDPAITGAIARVLNVEGGATSPQVSPDGRSVVYVGLTDRGYDIFSAPLDPAAAGEDAAIVAESQGTPQTVAPATRAVQGTGDLSSDSYSPLATLAPRSWEPRLYDDGKRLQLGAAVTGGDVLGYHGYAVDFVVPVSRIADLGPGRSRRRPDWSATYVYDRWRPAFFASASDSTTPYFDQVLARGRPPEDLEEQTREISAGFQVVWRRVRHAQNVLASVDLVETTLRSKTTTSTSSRNSIRLGWALNTARVFGYSISPEQGVTARLAYELVSPQLGADGSGRSATADVRLYVAAGPPHAVIALRAAAGAASGDSKVLRVFSLGGTQASSRYDFGRHAVGMIRGFPEDEVTGTRIAVVNVDFRVPLARLERGSGTRPIFFNTLSASAFVDAGTAWFERPAWREVRTSAGAELSFDLTLGYTFPVTFTTGAAWVRDPDLRRARGGPAFFVRFGRAF